MAGRHLVIDFYDPVQGWKNPAIICRCLKTGIGGKSGDHRTILKACDAAIRACSVMIYPELDQWITREQLIRSSSPIQREGGKGREREREREREKPLLCLLPCHTSVTMLSSKHNVIIDSCVNWTSAILVVQGKKWIVLNYLLALFPIGFINVAYYERDSMPSRHGLWVLWLYCVPEIWILSCTLKHTSHIDWSMARGRNMCMTKIFILFGDVLF